MSKFKTGDKIRLVDAKGTIDMTEGKVYEIVGVMPDGYPYIIDDVGDRSWWNARRFKLVPEYLTPEQVLQYFKEGREGELERINAEGEVSTHNCYIGVYYVLNSKWRVKPVPKTIDYYGTELPKPITKAEAIKLGLVELYTVQLTTMIVRGVSLDHIGESGVLCWATESDAKLVLDTLLKPFKQ